jgi:hypothetical protein
MEFTEVDASLRVLGLEFCALCDSIGFLFSRDHATAASLRARRFCITKLAKWRGRE